MPRYLPNADYNRLVAATLANAALFELPSCPFKGYPTEDEAKVVLGEHWNIWPALILPDVDAHK